MAQGRRNNDRTDAVHAERLSTVELTTEIVAAFVSNNTINPQDVPSLIASVNEALKRADGQLAPPAPEKLKPAVPVKRSVTAEHIICLEDGKKFKSLKRHLRTQYAMTPEEYRERWGLPHDYPMVAPNYAKARSALAKKMGLGTRRETD
ncbi:MAG: MucR family transcriptional regulator [Pseudomonadota bacterium]